MSESHIAVQPLTIEVRNDSYEPDLRREGTYLCSMPKPPTPPTGATNWHYGLKPYERLYYHQTMASVRYSKRYRPHPDLIPRDSLDFQLQSRYDHNREPFPNKVDPLLQRETCGAVTSWQHPTSQNQPGAYVVPAVRIMRNTRVLRAKKEDVLGHPLKIGGIAEKIHPHSVKLICSGVHNQLVNNGFSRQTSDGNFFRY